MKLGLAFAAAAVLASGAVVAQEKAAKPDVAKGQKIASQVCAACHGPDGNATGPGFPKLAGQSADYIVKQLTNYKPGKEGKADRVNAVMQGFASQLSPDDMRDVAAYYSSQKLIPDAAKNKETILLGQKIYRAGIKDKGIPACAGCHGAQGEGIPAQFPRLAGQWSDYVEAQMKAWRGGDRANDPNGMMRMVSARLSDQEIKAVADYIAGLR